MHTNHLAYFVEVAKQGSISRAARNLFISQPSLSASIAKLEEELGIKLFHRSQSGAQLTEQGAQILEVAEGVLQGVGEIQRIARQDTTLTGEVQIAAIPAACGNYIVDLIGLTQKRYPHLTLEVSEERPKQVIQQVLLGTVNLGLTSYRLDQEEAYQLLFQEKRLVYEALYEDSLCAYVAASHPLAQRSEATVAEINQYPLTCFKRDLYMHRLTDSTAILQQLGDSAFTRITYQFSNLDNIKRTAASSLAIAILPHRIEKCSVAEHKLVAIPVVDRDLRFTVGMLQRSSGVLSMAEQRTVEMLREISAMDAAK